MQRVEGAAGDVEHASRALHGRGAVGMQVQREWSRPRQDGPGSDGGCSVAGIAEARERLARAERRVTRMQLSLRGFDRTDPGLDQLLSCLHALERSRFNRRLELDALLRERARPSGKLAEARTLPAGRSRDSR